jgi:hypothetical protein
MGWVIAQRVTHRWTDKWRVTASGLTHPCDNKTA